MLNERIIRDYSIIIYMNNMNKTVNSKAIFNQKDIRTAVLMLQLFNNKVDNLPINLNGCDVVAKVLKNDDTQSLIKCSVLDGDNGLVAIGFTEQALLTGWIKSSRTTNTKWNTDSTLS